VDWAHLPAAEPSDGIDKAVIVETTPRIRKLHHWDATVLDQLDIKDAIIRLAESE